MILASHAIFGAAVARMVPQNPFLGFLLGIASHFVLDAIPHWDYSLKSGVLDENRRLVDMRIGKEFLIDISKIALDIAAGAGLAFIFFRAHTANDVYVLLAGIAGGVLPDGLQFLYFKFKVEPLKIIQKFHLGIQPRLTLKHRLGWGISSQVAIILAAVSLSLFLARLGL